MISRRAFLSYSLAAGASLLAVPTFAGCAESRSAASGSASAAASSEAASGSASAATTSADAVSSAAAASTTAAASDTTATPNAAASSAAAGSGKALVAYFSRTDENYQVGFIEEGNTAIVAKMIADQTGADLFEIAPVEAYPESYDECCDVAKEEQNENARPAIVDAGSLEGYDTVYLGYPIWWGDLPMCVYTYLESHDWAGKEIHPFCTHEGSGLSGTPSKIEQECAGATVADGFDITGQTAQSSRDETRAAVEAWLG